MGILEEHQIQRAIEALENYVKAHPDKEGKTPVEIENELDKNRINLIENNLKPLLSDYLKGNIELAEFKSTVDSINKINPFWGFKGIKGQMFFNMIFNVADNLEELDQELKVVLQVPENEEIASSRIKTFESYVKHLGEQWVDAGNSRYGCPKISSIPFFLSYFWQIQNREKWPVYYTNSVQAMEDLNLWQPSENLAEAYLMFKHIHEELALLFTKQTGEEFDLYKVEHVFWYRSGNITNAQNNDNKQLLGRKTDVTTAGAPDEYMHRLPESYIPPIVSILPKMAKHEASLIEAAKNSGTSLERAFEKYINATFTILGYDTKLMGQGQGRVPDGFAFAHDDNYAIIWDSKVRTDGYSMGTDDRTIREYINTQSRDLKKRRSLRNIYYMIISSSFAEDYDDTIRSIKMETNVSEVSLVEAEALVAMVDAKLRSPLQITLGPDGLQRLFSVSGILTAQNVRDQLM